MQNIGKNVAQRRTFLKKINISTLLVFVLLLAVAFLLPFSIRTSQTRAGNTAVTVGQENLSMVRDKPLYLTQSKDREAPDNTMALTSQDDTSIDGSSPTADLHEISEADGASNSNSGGTENNSPIPVITDTLPAIDTVSVYNHESGEVFEIDLDEYTALTVLAEMPTSFEQEALRAQAVACRTLAVNLILSGSRVDKHSGAAICTDYQHCQSFTFKDAFIEKYGDAGKQAYEKAKDAADATSGIIAVYEGEPIMAVFHAQSGRTTAASEDVWGGKVDYLVPVPSVDGEDQSEQYYKTVTLTGDELIRRLAAKGYRSLNQYKGEALASWFGPLKLTPSGTVDSVHVGDEEIPGGTFRSAVGLRSQDYSYSLDDTAGTITLTSYGYGHGVGLSQTGANLLAKQGKNFYDILKYYYTGISFALV